MRFSFRGRTADQRGYVLISAIVLAILYFGLMELMLIDSSRALVEADRFRSRVIASTLAESGAELVAAQMITHPVATASAHDDQGSMTAHLTTVNNEFQINAQGVTSGVAPATATVRVQGRIIGTHIAIDYTFHSQ